MDISNEASVDSFKIGPSTILGRTIAFRVLFCKSVSHLRHQIFRLLLYTLYQLKKYFSNYLKPMISWLHPRNPQGILVMVTLIAFLLKRYTNVKMRAEMAYRRKFWRNMMRAALTYEEWAHAAKMLEKETPRMNKSDLYDEELVRNKLQELRHRRQEGSLRDIIFCMRADLVRNLGNMCNPELHKGRLQVPRLIKEYIIEVSTQLRMVCDSDSEELLLEEKLAFVHETRHAFGRTALLLSGGASLGAFHVGVVKTLVEHKLMPRIIAGSSVGSIMCAVVATRSWPELQSFFEDSWRSLQFFDQMGGIFTVFRRVMTQGAVHEIRQLQVMLRNLTNNLTFQEAYDMTGRVLGITVCSPRKHEPPRCLNYLTSPHVVIWSAVTASCAFPGLFEAQELMAKDRSGEIVPYHPPFHLGPDEASGTSARRWRDGSLEIDLPMMQLKELFNVNHFIVSQANPHIAPLLRLKEFVRAYGGHFAAKLAHLLEMEVKHRCDQILELGFPLGGIAKLFAQDWEGDVTVVMPATLAQYSKIIQNPSHLELQKAANQGRRCTWEKLSAIKANCGIELALDECVAILNHMRRLKRSAERAAAASASSHGLPNNNNGRFNASKRIPSWNCIARENSTGSLEEDLLADVASSLHQGGGVGGGTTSWSWRNRNVHDGSDSESETADLNTWTRSGGPLMRTTSSDKFIDEIERERERLIDEAMDLLPENCVAQILSLTSPGDACRLSIISSGFQRAAESDVIWEIFLPPDYREIISTAVSPVAVASKKELFLRLHNPLLIDGGNKTFSIEKRSGKKCYMLSARELSVSWASNPLFWCWKSHLQSRFTEVVELIIVSWLEIVGKINTNILSPNTTYGAFLVFKIADRAFGLDSIPSEVSIEVSNHRSEGTTYLRLYESTKRELLEKVFAHNRIQMLRSRVTRNGGERIVAGREDGWLEIELGEFYNGGERKMEEVKMSFREVKGQHLKGGLIVEGIEIRPK